MNTMPVMGPAAPERLKGTVTRHIRTASWAVVGLLTVAVIASLVLDGFSQRSEKEGTP